MHKCDICGLQFKHYLVSCDKCSRDGCINCIDFKTRLCIDCQIVLYIEKYKNNWVYAE